MAKAKWTKRMQLIGSRSNFQCRYNYPQIRKSKVEEKLMKIVLQIYCLTIWINYHLFKDERRKSADIESPYGRARSIPNKDPSQVFAPIDVKSKLSLLNRFHKSFIFVFLFDYA